MSTKPCAEGVEVLAMAPESVEHLERVGARLSATASAPASAPARAEPRPSTFGALGTEAARPQPAARGGVRRERVEPTLNSRLPDPEVGEDVRQLEMSTLSFQDYVRERMLKRRQAELGAAQHEPEPPVPPVVSPIAQARARLAAQHAERVEARQSSMPAHGFADSTFGAPGVARAAAMAEALARPTPRSPAQPVPQAAAPRVARPAAAPVRPASMQQTQLTQPTQAAEPVPALHKVAPVKRPERPEPPVLHRPLAQGGVAAPTALAEPRQDQTAMMSELRSMRGLIEQRFGALAFMEKLQRQPRQAQLTQRLLDAGFSPALTRRLAECLPAEVEEISWAAGVLERNLATGEREAALEDVGGVYALIGATGVGKTTSTAKLAAAFATKHGATNLGLVTLDAYRVAAHEQLRTYGRILGVPVHTAHDRASLEDLLELLSGKRMVLIDTAGMAQRDTRTRELLEMLQRPSINRLVVISAAAQGETIEDQLSAYAGPGCRGVVLSKVDEAVKLAPALDAMIRARLKVLAVANGQRVPEDWHRLSAHALVQRALRAQGAPAWRMEPAEVNLVFAGQPFAADATRTAPAALA
ncbi:MAG: flagellar biosynthesis protein FlhF [Burkholderiales bacterium]|nr:flagellar biosynthesis protein FlhF [Burkholderiales bacterium]